MPPLKVLACALALVLAGCADRSGPVSVIPAARPATAARCCAADGTCVCICEALCLCCAACPGKACKP